MTRRVGYTVRIDAETEWSSDDPWLPELEQIIVPGNIRRQLPEGLGYYRILIQHVPRGIRIMTRVTPEGVQFLTPGGNPVTRSTILRAMEALAPELERLLTVTPEPSDDLLLDGVLADDGIYVVHDVLYGRFVDGHTPWVTPAALTSWRWTSLLCLRSAGGFQGPGVILAGTVERPTASRANGFLSSVLALGDEVLVKGYSYAAIGPGSTQAYLLTTEAVVGG